MDRSTMLALAVLVPWALLVAACGTPVPMEKVTSPLSTPRVTPIQVPNEGADVTLPLHILARVGEPGQEVKATLRWDDGTELSVTFLTLAHPDGGGLLIDSLDWRTETRPPQPGTQPATLSLASPSGQVLAEAAVTVLSADHPRVQLIDLYWTLGEGLETEQRYVVGAGEPARAALEELLWGPSPGNLAGFGTALPTPQEVLAYPGRQPDWGVRVNLRDLTVQAGLATADFSREMQAYGGGSMRVETIRAQIRRTLLQFSGIDEARIAVEGDTEGVLQP